MVALFSLLWSASVISGELVVSQGYARATPPGIETGAAYFTLSNNDPEKSVVLVGVTSDRAKQVMVHQNQLQGDMMRMRHVSELEIAAGSQFSFEPGGHHLMLVGLNQPLRAGDKLQLALRFQHGDVLEVSLPILAIGAVVETEMKSHHE